MEHKTCPFLVTLRHIGLNADNSEQAETIARFFSEMFALQYKPGNSSVFAGEIIEVMRRPFRGTYGHIAMGVDDIEASRSYFEEKGWLFVEETIKRNASGKIVAVYLRGEIGGFAVHLLRN